MLGLNGEDDDEKKYEAASKYTLERNMYTFFSGSNANHIHTWAQQAKCREKNDFDDVKMYSMIRLLCRVRGFLRRHPTSSEEKHFLFFFIVATTMTGKMCRLFNGAHKQASQKSPI